MFNGKINYKWPFSIAMLNYQRVNANQNTCFDGQKGKTHPVLTRRERLRDRSSQCT